jgi:hypothetical protein
MGPQNVRLDGLDGIILIMNRRCGTGQMIDPVDLQQDGFDYVVPQQFEIAVPEKAVDVLSATGKEVVEADDLFAFPKQSLAEV